MNPWLEQTEVTHHDAPYHDNGSPFASIGLARLTRLSAWWIRLGIRPETIEPGKPQQNGRHGVCQG